MQDRKIVHASTTTGCALKPDATITVSKHLTIARIRQSITEFSTIRGYSSALGLIYKRQIKTFGEMDHRIAFVSALIFQVRSASKPPV
jgi:hypothetical protein